MAKACHAIDHRKAKAVGHFRIKCSRVPRSLLTRDFSGQIINKLGHMVQPLGSGPKWIHVEKAGRIIIILLNKLNHQIASGLERSGLKAVDSNVINNCRTTLSQHEPKIPC